MDGPEVSTLGVLADLATITLVAMVLAAGAYKALRSLWPQTAWNYSGQVFVRPYVGADAAVVAAVAVTVWYGLQTMMASGGGSANEVPAEGNGIELLLGNMVFLLLICSFLLFYLRRIRGLDPVQLFGLQQVPVLRAFGIAFLVLLLSLLPIWLLAGYALQWLQGTWPDLGPQETVQLFVEQEGWGVRILLGVTAIVVAPLVEETVFRGFIYGVLKRFTDSHFAALITSLLFALVHFHLGSVVPLFVLALAFTIAYERTGSLLVPIFMHALFNTTTLLILLFVGVET